MSSHREAPTSTLLTTLAKVPTLNEAQVGGIMAFQAFEQVDPIDADMWHVNLNITDLFVFQKPGAADKTIFIMNVNPMPPKLSDAFDDTAVYEFRIDTNADARAEIAFRVTFSPYTNGQQSAMVKRASGAQALTDGDDGQVVIANAPVSFHGQPQITTAGDYAFFAGPRSDPFFFDLMGFCNNFHFTGSDYFADKDVFGIVLEVPNNALGEHAKVGVWSRVLWAHHDEWLRVARLGLPLVNILFNGVEDKDLFNRTEPEQQVALFMDKFVAQLVALGHSAAKARELAQLFLPDILPYDYSSTRGFFNGRRLNDDVVDQILTLVTGGKIQSDQVGPHSDYLSAFPYLGQPHGR